MMHLLKKLFLGNAWLQPAYELLFKVAVKGMNYDRGHVPGLSGEKYVLQRLKRKNGDRHLVVFDVGANTGQYAAVAIAALKTNFHLHSFEPQVKAFTELAAISRAPFFSPHQLALGAAAGELDLYCDREGSAFASMYPSVYRDKGIILDQSEKVAVTSIDGFCDENDIRRIDLLKIDVEGHEIEVLKGCQRMIADGKIPLIQFEFGIASIKARIFMADFIDTLKDYDIYRILRNGLRKIDYSEYAELFLTTNYLAIRKPGPGEGAACP